MLGTVGFFKPLLYTKLSKSKTFEVKENAEPSPKYKVPSVLPGFFQPKQLNANYGGKP